MSRVLILTQGEEQIFEAAVWAELSQRYPAALVIDNLPDGYPETMRWDHAVQGFVPREQPVEPPKSGQISAASGVIGARPGATLLIFGLGVWGDVTTAQTVRLSYGGQVVAAHPVKQAATADRTGLSLAARVEAIEGAEATITATGGSIYDARILWMEVEK